MSARGILALLTNFYVSAVNIGKYLENYRIIVYNVFCRSNPIRQDFLTVYSPAVMPSAFRFTGSDAESTKGGMFMKSKHCTYGKKATRSDFCSHRLNDTILHKSTIAALGQGRLS